MGYYARREKRRKAIQKQIEETFEKDPWVRIANNARDVAIVTLTVAAALMAVGVLQRSFWASFGGERI